MKIWKFENFETFEQFEQIIKFYTKTGFNMKIKKEIMELFWDQHLLDDVLPVFILIYFLSIIRTFIGWYSVEHVDRILEVVVDNNT